MTVTKKDKIKIIFTLAAVGILSTVAGLLMTDNEWFNMGLFILTMFVNITILGLLFKNIKL